MPGPKQGEGDAHRSHRWRRDPVIAVRLRAAARLGTSTGACHPTRSRRRHLEDLGHPIRQRIPRAAPPDRGATAKEAAEVARLAAARDQAGVGTVAYWGTGPPS